MTVLKRYDALFRNEVFVFILTDPFCGSLEQAVSQIKVTGMGKVIDIISTHSFSVDNGNGREGIGRVYKHHTAVTLVMVKGTCYHRDGAYVLGGGLKKSASQTHISVTLAHNGLTFCKALHRKLILTEDPVFVFAFSAVINYLVMVICIHCITSLC